VACTLRRGSGDRLVVVSLEACPEVAVWTAGKLSRPQTYFRLGLSASGDLLPPLDATRIKQHNAAQRVAV